jgi:hypothetical protein
MVTVLERKSEMEDIQQVPATRTSRSLWQQSLCTGRWDCDKCQMQPPLDDVVCRREEREGGKE